MYCEMTPPEGRDPRIDQQLYVHVLRLVYLFGHDQRENRPTNTTSWKESFPPTGFSPALQFLPDLR
jgi:hypothetical protein